MRVKKLIGTIAVVGWLAFPFEIEAITSKTGVTSSNFLKLGVGPRAAAMGEAFSAVADDVTAIYWNPAGLVQLQKDELAVMYKQWFADINSGFLAYGHPLGKSTLAGAINYVDDGQIQQRRSKDENNGVIFRPEDLAVSLSHAHYLTRNLAIGSTIKYIHQKLHNETANGLALDTGFLYQPWEFLYLSGVVQHFGTKMKFVEEGFDLPLTFKLGLSYRLKTLIFAADYSKSTDNKPCFNFGFESKIGPIITMRLGYRYDTSDNKLDLYKSSPVGLSGGLGLNLGDVYYLDYAYAPYGDLGDTQRIALSMKMSKPKIMPAPPVAAPPVRFEPEIPERLEELAKEIKPEEAKKAYPAPPRPEIPVEEEIPPSPITRPEVKPEEPQAKKVEPAKEIIPEKKPSKVRKPKITPIIKPQLKVEEKERLMPPEKIEPKGLLTVLVDEVIVWSGPGATYSQITKVHKGDKLTLLDDSKQFYLKVLLPDGTTGWICYVFVSK